jgi:hypothetical protein
VCEVVVTALVDEEVIDPGVPSVTVPVPVIVVKFIPLPEATDVTVPDPPGTVCHVPSSRRYFVPVLARMGRRPVADAVATEIISEPPVIWKDACAVGVRAFVRRESEVSTRSEKSVPESTKLVPVVFPKRTTLFITVVPPPVSIRATISLIFERKVL